MASIDDIISRLEAVSEDLGDLSISRLRDALEGDTSAADDDKRIARARPAVDKATAVLAGMPDAGD